MIHSNSSASRVSILYQAFTALRDDALAVLMMCVIASISGGLLVSHWRSHKLYHPAITLSELRMYVEAGDLLILDARNGSDYAAGHIPTAFSLPIAEWKTRSAELKAVLRQHRDHLVIVYCADSGCGQADELQMALIDLGHTRVGRFAEGFSTWQSAGFPVAHSP